MAILGKADLARGVIDRFPEHSTRALASVLYKENSAMFKDYESARSSIRYARGKQGEENRQRLKKAGIPQKQQAVRTQTLSLPEPKEVWDSEWEPHVLRARKVLNISDVHVPYFDKTALEVALKLGQDEGVDCILLNGDFMDFFAISRWDKDPRKRDFAGEIEMGREILHMLREEFKGCQIVWKIGNHEERWEAYLYNKAPEILGVSDFEVENVMRCHQFNIRTVRDMRPIKLNKLHILHGHEYKFAISNPVNPARGLYLRAKANATMGHLHQSSEHTERDLNGKITTCWSQGCLCNLHPSYAPLNKWNHGVQIIDTTGEDDFRVHNYRIDKGRIY